MTPVTSIAPITRVAFSVFGIHSSRRRYCIGTACFTFEPSGLTDKANFVLNLDRIPSYFLKTILVPNHAAIPAAIPASLLTTYRICETQHFASGEHRSYGVGIIRPSEDEENPGMPCYEIVSDYGAPLNTCGRFIAEHDPYAIPNYFTLSAAA